MKEAHGLDYVDSHMFTPIMLPVENLCDERSPIPARLSVDLAEKVFILTSTYQVSHSALSLLVERVKAVEEEVHGGVEELMVLGLWWSDGTMGVLVHDQPLNLFPKKLSSYYLYMRIFRENRASLFNREAKQ